MAQFRQLQKQVLDELEAQPASGRLVLSITSSIEEWRNTPADIIVQPGDEITIPRNKQFVMVTGQAYNPSAIAYQKGRTAGWYLSAAGGSTRTANDKDIYIIRANGLVVAAKRGFLGGGVLSTKMRPGDTLVVPQKINIGSSGWRAVAQSSQVISALAIAARAVAGF
jgi:protein involved in polysaccharide export with SLBB domain